MSIKPSMDDIINGTDQAAAPDDAPLTINVTPAPNGNVVMSDSTTLDDEQLDKLLGNITNPATEPAPEPPTQDPKPPAPPDLPGDSQVTSEVTGSQLPNSRLEAEQAAGRAALERIR